ncbi:hypothetical protein [Bacillus sonorensis]|uniref:hypothetical protein n=1 Tax=Bacillus sonorensis TaxID=119858 RepID=UPI00227FA39F|nr:hypothetical protein [Bacillus sonorensis]MCY8034295.1 transposase family protein [Bacillus sonorensis]MCY8565350.1 transposase family protein [Bacillus sonorensis]
MPRSMIEKLIDINPDLLNTHHWPTVLESELPLGKQRRFKQRKLAIDLYFKRIYTMKEISNLSSLSSQEIRRLLKRCLRFDEHGQIFGYRALIPGKRICKNNPNIRNTNKKGFANSFSQLMKQYPELKEFLINTFLKKMNNSVSDNVISIKHLHQKFIRECRKLNIDNDSYPFNTTDAGYRSLLRFVQQLTVNHTEEAIFRIGENKSHTFKHTGSHHQKATLITSPFEQVQLDGHKIDVELALRFKTLEGDEIVNTLNRIYLLTIIDTATRVVIGYHLCLEREYDQNDVLKCIMNAIRPHEKMKLNIPNLHYPDNGGFPSLAIPETQWGIWTQILFDNAKSHLANRVRDSLTKDLGCHVNYGPVKFPEYRSIVERFFRILEEDYFHRLPSTTGSNPSDPKRRNSSAKAIKYEITIDELQELIEVCLAHYNNSPNYGVNNLTPLETMKQRISREGPPRVLDEHKRKHFTLLNIKAKRKIQGGYKKGRRPYIYFEGVVYTNEVLANSSSLAGKSLYILANTDDLRSIQAFFEDGSELGILTAKGKWGIVPHDLKIRRAIFKLRRDRKIYFTELQNPIEIYQEYLREKAVTHKSSRNKLNKVMNKTERDSIAQKENKNSQESPPKTKEYLNNSDYKREFQKKIPSLTKTILY